jgi:hypothetical protein
MWEHSLLAYPTAPSISLDVLLGTYARFCHCDTTWKWDGMRNHESGTSCLYFQGQTRPVAFLDSAGLEHKGWCFTSTGIYVCHKIYYVNSVAYIILARHPNIWIRHTANLDRFLFPHELKQNFPEIIKPSRNIFCVKHVWFSDLRFSQR